MSRLDRYLQIYKDNPQYACREPNKLNEYMADYKSPQGQQMQEFCAAAACMHCAWIEYEDNRKGLNTILNQKDNNNDTDTKTNNA